MATERFRRFVEAGQGQPAPRERPRHRVFLGSDTFVGRMQAHIHELEGDLGEVPAARRRPRMPPLRAYRDRYASRNEAIAAAYASGGYSMKEIGRCFGLHYSRVSRIVKRKTRRAKGKT